MGTNAINIEIPKDIENLALPSPELITFYKNIEDRVLWIDSEIDNYCLEFARYIIQWNKEDKDIPAESRKPIKLMVTSGGGDLSTTNSIIDVIKISKTPIYGYNMGLAASGACFIFMACHKRFTLPKASFLIHQGSAENISGTFEQILLYVHEYQRQIEELAQYILENSSIDEETLEENITSEWYMDSETAVRFGVCDFVIKSIDEII